MPCIFCQIKTMRVEARRRKTSITVKVKDGNTLFRFSNRKTPSIVIAGDPPGKCMCDVQIMSAARDVADGMLDSPGETGYME